MRRRRRYFRYLLPFMLSLSLLLATTAWQQPVALAHAFVIGSDPVDGSTINVAPTVVRIFFDTNISSASVAHVYVFTPNQHEVDIGHSIIPTNNHRELDTPLISPAQLPEGGYEVQWTALSNDDGHTTHGLIGFNLGHSSTGLSGVPILGPTTSNTAPTLDLVGTLSIAWDWLVLMALTFWLGILITEGLILEGSERNLPLLTRTRKQTRPLQWICLTALLVGEVVALILRATYLTQSLGGGGIDLIALRQIVLATNYGHLWLVRISLIVIALGALYWATHQQGNPHKATRPRLTGSRFRQMRQRVTQEQKSSQEAQAEQRESTSPAPTLPRRYTIISLVVAGLILFTLALTGDAAQLAQPHISAIMLDWLYLTARTIWLGSLTYLAYVLLPLLPVVEPDQHTHMLTSLLHRFHPLMLAAIAILVVSGVYLGEASISDSQQFLTDPYGRTLLIESLLIVLMIALSTYEMLILRPKVTRQMLLLPVVDAELPARRTRQSALKQTQGRIKQVLSIQSWLGAAVLLCAALMVFFAPPIVFPAIDYTSGGNSNTSLPPTTNIHAQTKQVGNLSVALQVLPGQVNYANTVVITMNDSAGNPVTDAQLQISTNMEVMDMGTAHASIIGNNPTYVATFKKGTAFSMDGTWDITVKIQRPHQAPLETVFSVTLGGS